MATVKPKVRRDESGTLEWLYDYVMSMRNFQVSDGNNMPKFGEIVNTTAQKSPAQGVQTFQTGMHRES